MTKGHVSVEWAEQHHDLWYEEVKDTVIDAESSEGVPSSSVQTSS